ncbi:MAG: prepilin-type N-terminal cleavage/methylation domain-containing protein [Candidatus Omnitrophica bacterium]|nr:prepilin-type N-terminal cleavage/methylation domain-containing protein [Candidatus Omnitrophota bacterium]
MKYLSKRAFTLIELLIVLSILGVLIALAVPRYANLASDKNLKVCQGNLRTLDSALAVYRVEQGDWPDANDVTKIVSGGYLQAVPDCPGGGSYALTSTNERTSCNISGHTLPSQP